MFANAPCRGRLPAIGRLSRLYIDGAHGASGKEIADNSSMTVTKRTIMTAVTNISMVSTGMG